MLNLNSTVQRTPDILAAEAGQDLVMVSIANGHYYGISDVARSIWEALENPRKVSDLIDELTSSYDIDPESCARDTISFLEELRAEALIQVSDGPVA